MATDRMDTVSDTTDADFMRQVRERFTESETAWEDNRKLALDDVKHIDGSGQWPENIRKERESDGRPCLTINRLPGFVDQVIGDARQNRPRIRVRPVDTVSDPDIAQIIEGLIRNIEYTSHAEHAYDTAFEHAAGHGFGYFRILKDYSSEDTFDQELKISRIKNAFSVYPDPAAQEADLSDMRYCFVTEMVSKDEFKSRFPNVPHDFEMSSSTGTHYEGWFYTDKVRIAEYWERVPIERVIVLLSDGMVMRQENVTPEMQIIRQRTVKSWQVKQYIVSGSEILEGPTVWEGQYIPIIPVLGKELVVDGKTIYRGVIRHAKDSQRAYNYWRHLAVDTPLPTPNGWTTMGDVRVGDELFDENGNPCKVIGKSPVQIHHDCYKVTFDDGSNIVASDSHVWQVEERGKLRKPTWEWSIKKVTTLELAPGKHFIWMGKPLKCQDVNLPIHPYLLGLWLGDGSSLETKICPGDEDINEVYDRLKSFGCNLSAIKDRKNKHKDFTVLGVHREFIKLGLFSNKHVPDIYLRASREQRWLLLQGFMDSDGSIGKSNRQCSYTTVSKFIADGFAELLRSLGIKSVSLQRKGRYSKIVGGESILQDVTQFSFSCYANEPVFGLSRKKITQHSLKSEHRRRTKRHSIISVEKVKSVPVQCVGIDAPSHLFLAGEAMVPTHNSMATETVALQPRAPYLATTAQVVGYEDIWRNANRKSYSYLPYNNTGDPMPQRQFPSALPQGAFSEAQVAVDDMKATTGIYDASLGNKSNEISGKAILARQREGDTGTFPFHDNLSRAIQHAGRILVEMIPYTYDTERVIRVMNEDGTDKTNEINKAGVVDGIPYILNDITVGKYDVVVESGPSYSTQRQEAAASIVEFMQAIPGQAPLMADVAAKNMDWPEADKVAQRLRKALPPGIAEPEEGDVPQEPEPNPDAEMAARAAEMEAEKMKLEYAKLDIERMKLEVEKFKIETELERERIKYAMAGAGGVTPGY